MAELRLSDDGLYYWDGRQWISTLSPDGHWRWNGSAWVPMTATVAPGFAPYPSYQQPVTPRVPTAWTKPMQYAVAAWYALSGIYALSLPFNIVGAVAGSTPLNPYSLPVWVTWLSVALGIPSTALFIWMLVAVIRHGPWAMTRRMESPGKASPAPAS